MHSTCTSSSNVGCVIHQFRFLRIILDDFGLRRNSFEKNEKQQ